MIRLRMVDMIETSARRYRSWTLVHWAACLSLISAVFLFSDAAAANTGDDLQALRALLEQQQEIIQHQQRQIDDLARDVEALKVGSRPAERTLENSPPAVGEMQENAEQAEVEVRVVHEPADATAPGQVDQPADAGSRERYKVAIGGNLNRQVNVADDGDRTKAYFLDSSNIPTNGFIKATARVNDDLTFGAHIEVGLQDNAATSVSQTNETAGFNTTGRVFEATADSETYGKGSFGKGFAAAFGIFEVDASGTQAGNLLSVGNTAGGLLFYSDDLDDYSPITVSDAFLDLEGLQRVNRVRYDSPKWNGFRLGGTLGENQYKDVALRYASALGDFDVTAITSYQDNPNGPFSERRNDGGVGVKHLPTGLNLTAGGARQHNRDGQNADGFTVRAGLRRNWFDFGETATAIDFQRSWDITASGDRATSFGAFALQNIDEFGLQLYTGYRLYDLDRDDIDLDPIHVWTFGARVQFEVDASWGQY